MLQALIVGGERHSVADLVIALAKLRLKWDENDDKLRKRDPLRRAARHAMAHPRHIAFTRQFGVVVGTVCQIVRAGTLMALGAAAAIAAAPGQAAATVRRVPAVKRAPVTVCASDARAAGRTSGLAVDDRPRALGTPFGIAEERGEGRAGRVDVREFGAVAGDGRDDRAAFEAAVQAVSSAGRGVIYVPPGVWDLSAPIVSQASNVHVIGDGPGATVIRALPGFSGTSLLILGRKPGPGCVQSAGVTNAQAKGITLDGNGQRIAGLEVYGVRDASAFEDIYVRNQVAVAGIIVGQSCDAAGAASTFMSEGVQFRNVWVIGGPWASGEAWRLDGLYESQIIGGGVRGLSTTVNSGVRGFKIGTRAGVQGLTLLGASVTMIKDGGDGRARTNVGIEWGPWARDSRDIGTTFEGVTGPAVFFNGSDVSGSVLPFNIQTISPRVYSYAKGQADGFGRNADYFLDPVARFGVANHCRVSPIVASSPWKTWVRFDGSVGQQGNSAEIVVPSANPEALRSRIISFDPKSAKSNWVNGVASADAERRFFTLTRDDSSVEYESNGFRTAYDAQATTMSAGASDVIRFNGRTGNEILELDGQKRMISAKARLHVDDRWSGPARLELGPYRLWIDERGRLRVKKGDPVGDQDGTVVGTQE